MIENEMVGWHHRLCRQEFEEEWIHVYVRLGPFVVHLELSQLLIGYQFSSVQLLSHI